MQVGLSLCTELTHGHRLHWFKTVFMKVYSNCTVHARLSSCSIDSTSILFSSLSSAFAPLEFDGIAERLPNKPTSRCLHALLVPKMLPSCAELHSGVAQPSTSRSWTLLLARDGCRLNGERYFEHKDAKGFCPLFWPGSCEPASWEKHLRASSQIPVHFCPNSTYNNSMREAPTATR